MGHYDEAEAWLRKCLLVSNPGESHVRKAYALLASSLARQGKLHEAHEACRHGLELFPEDDELLFRLAIQEHRAGHFERAIRAYRTILNHDQPRHFSSRDRGITGYKAKHNLALVYEDAGRLDLAELQWRRITAQMPHYESAFLGLERMLKRQGKVTACSDFSNWAVQTSMTSPPNGDEKETKEKSDRLPAAVGAESDHAKQSHLIATIRPDDTEDWPACHSRWILHSTQGAVRLCAHPKVSSTENVVPLSICTRCRHRLLPPPTHFRELRPPTGKVRYGSCRHLGGVVGERICDGCRGNVRLKVFACSHPAHEATTLSDCQKCADYQPKDENQTTRPSLRLEVNR
jgi:hypothetical protein